MPHRKRVHPGDQGGRPATRGGAEPQALLMAAAAVFWTAPAAVVAPNAENAAAPNAGAPVMREAAGRKAPLRGTTFDDKSNF